MWKKWTEYIRKYNLIEEGDGIVAGVSGGADSVCLLRLLCELREQYRLGIHVVHVNHGLRGREADEDEEFVGRLCEQFRVSFRAVHADVRAYAKERGIGEEEAGRELRYRAFMEECLERGCRKAAVAHNLEDQAETVLFRLFRGTSALGLVGIRPVRELKPGSGILLIRPLLDTSRAEIEAYLKEAGQDYRIDRTNLSGEYARNVIRNEILTTAKDKVNTKAVRHIVQTSEQILELTRIFREVVCEKERGFVQEREDGILLSDGLAGCEKLLAYEIIFRTFEKLRGDRKDFGAVHAERVFDLFSAQCGRRANLPAGLQARRTYGGILLGREQNADLQETKKLFIPVTLPGEWYIQELDCLLRIETAIYEKNIIIPKSNYTKWFDYDKIKDTLILRTRREGDYLQIRPDGGKKTLKSLMIDEKIPVNRRNRIPLLAAGSHVLWVLGGRSSEAFRIGENTGRILKASIYGGYEYGGED